MAGTDQFEAVFERLKGILEPYGEKLHVTANDSTWYGVDMAPENERNPTTYFGGIRRGKAYVSYYLMPVYVEPSLLDDISPELRNRMQGKSCFNFRAVDDELFDELAALTRRGYEATSGKSTWGVAKREERGMDYRKAMSVDRATHDARRGASQAKRGGGGRDADGAKARGTGGKSRTGS